MRAGWGAFFNFPPLTPATHQSNISRTETNLFGGIQTNMKVAVIGGTGTIGKAIVGLLSAHHEVISVGQTHGDYQVDISSKDSIQTLFDQIGQVDAVVSAAGQARFRPLDQLTDDDYAFSLYNKLMGQVNVVRVGLPFVKDGGSFTLTSGILAGSPMVGSGVISLVNAGLEGFTRAAALEAPRGIRVNIVSPPWVTETMIAMGMDPSGGMPASKVAETYAASVEGDATGQVLMA
jgi:NAD(P)-dependent dehydrogenase (short-subunit alcohol dehydrogenase family)